MCQGESEGFGGESGGAVFNLLRGRPSRSAAIALVLVAGELGEWSVEVWESDEGEG